MRRKSSLQVFCVAPGFSPASVGHDTSGPSARRLFAPAGFTALSASWMVLRGRPSFSFQRRRPANPSPARQRPLGPRSLLSCSSKIVPPQLPPLASRRLSKRESRLADEPRAINWSLASYSLSSSTFPASMCNTYVPSECHRRRKRRCYRMSCDTHLASLGSAM